MTQTEISTFPIDGRLGPAAPDAALARQYGLALFQVHEAA